MKWVYAEQQRSASKTWSDDEGCPNYGVLTEQEAAIRKHIKNHFSELKEKQIKDLLDRKTWLTQKQILLKAKQLQQTIGTEQFDDMNGYDEALTAACNAQAIKLETNEKKQITDAVSWKNPAAEKVIKKLHKNTKPNPIYGMFKVGAQVLEYKTDSDLRDNENVALDPTQTVNDINEAYFKKEVLPHVPDAWIDANKKDEKDNEIGIVGYEIPFNRHFYQYQPPRDLVEIDADLDAVSAEIMALLREVHS